MMRFCKEGIKNSEVDDCSVIKIGALTSKVYSFGLRKWDLQCVESCDIYDDIYGGIRVESFGLRIIRVLPVVERGGSEEWITDIVRFGLESLLARRLSVPLVRLEWGLVAVSWFDVMRGMFYMFDDVNMKVSLLKGFGIDGEAELIVKELEWILEGVVDVRSLDGRNEYVNDDFEDVKFAVLLNIDMRSESPLLEVMVRLRSYLRVGFWVDGISNMDSSSIGVGEFISGRNKKVSFVMNGERTYIFYGYEEGNEEEMRGVRGVCNTISKVLYVYNKMVGRNVGYEIGSFSSYEGGLVYNIGDERVDYGNVKYLIYQGTHIMNGVRYASSVLPSGLFLESEGLFLNSFGSIKVAKVIFDIPGICRKGWRILMFVRNMVEFDKEGYGSLIRIRRRIYESSSLSVSSAYMVRIIEVIMCGWFITMSNVRYDFFVSSYYRKFDLRRVYRTIGLAELFYGTQVCF